MLHTLKVAAAGLAAAIVVTAPLMAPAAGRRSYVRRPNPPVQRLDLQVTSVRVLTTNPISDTPVTLQVGVRNRSRITSGGCTLAVLVDGQEWQQSRISTVPALRQVSCCVSGQMPAGMHTVTAIAGATSSCVEANQTDNSRSVAVTVQQAETQATLTGQIADYHTSVGIPGVTVIAGGIEGYTDCQGRFQIGGVDVTSTRMTVNGENQHYYTFWARMLGRNYDAMCIPVPPLTPGETADTGTIYLMDMESPPPFPPDCQ